MMTTPTVSSSGGPPPSPNDANNNSSPAANQTKATRWQKSEAQSSQEQAERVLPRFVFDPDSGLVCYWTAAVALVTLYNAWTIALRISFPEMRNSNDQSYYLPVVDVLCDIIYLLDIIIQLRTAYLLDGIPVFDPLKIRQHYLSQAYFVQDVVCVLPTHTLLAMLPDSVAFFKFFLCSAGAARITKLLKFHILYKFYDLAESFTSNPHLIRVLRLFLNLAIIIHWIACLYYLLSEYEGLGSNDWVYSNATDQQRFSRKYLKCLYWSAMTLTTIGDTNTPETDLEYIFTGVIFLTGVFVFATVMGNVADVISSMNANRQEFQARMDHIQMYLTHKKVPVSLQLKIKKWAEYTWSRTKATDESRLLNMLPERLRAEVAVHVHLDSLKKVKIFEQCETGFLCELVLKLRSQVYSPGDYVCRVGETGREMFIINHGKVEVVVNNPASSKPMVVAVLSEGNYFGEISLLRLDGVQNRRTADVRSIGYSELLCLSRRDLMAALVEYPEAKSVLEDQAKKRMKTNLQAQRAFSVDTFQSASSSSVDSGIAKDELTGHEVSEIKAMIEELKNANKVSGRSVWQMIAKCEVLQAKLDEKEKEVEDSKHRIRDLETLLFTRHCPRRDPPEEPQEETEDQTMLRPGRKEVKKQYSQEEGRRSFGLVETPPDSVRIVPDVKITPSSESGDEPPNTSFIRTSKITNIFEKPSNKRPRSQNMVEEDRDCGTFNDDIKVSSENVWNMDLALDYNFTNETSIDHEFVFEDNKPILMTARFRDEFHLEENSSSSSPLDLNVHTIPEESEEDNPESCSSDLVSDARVPPSSSSNHSLTADNRISTSKNSSNDKMASEDAASGSCSHSEITAFPNCIWKRLGTNFSSSKNGDTEEKLESSGIPTSTDSSLRKEKMANEDSINDSCSNNENLTAADQKPIGNRLGTQLASAKDDSTTEGFTNVLDEKPNCSNVLLEKQSDDDSAHQLKRLLDGQASKSFKSVSGMDFLRMASMRSHRRPPDRKSSWVGSDCEESDEEDSASS